MGVEERIWRRPGVSYERVFAGAIGVSHRGKSIPLERVLSDFGAEHSFVQAAGRVQEHYGFEITPSAVRVCTLKTAKRAEKIPEAKYAEPFRLLPETGVQSIIAQADGTMICTVEAGKRRDDKRPRSWNEMRVVAVQAQGSTQATYGATFGSVQETARVWGHCARDAGRGLDTSLHVVADGAPWISLQAREVFGDDHRFLCGFFHVSEYLTAAAHTCAPSRSEPWRRTQQRRLKRSASSLVIAELAQHLEPPDSPDSDAPVRNAHRYLSNRADSLDYQSAIENDLPIGSGLIESTHRHLLLARLKKAATSWLPQTAQSLAQLRVIRANNLWPALWNN